MGNRLQHDIRVGITIIAAGAAMCSFIITAAAATDAPTARPPHESPKSPTGNGGATLVLAVIATVLVGTGIIAGAQREGRGQCAMPPSKQSSTDVITVSSAATMRNRPANEAIPRLQMENPPSATENMAASSTSL